MNKHLKRYRDWRDARARRALTLRLDDHMLKDIGLLDERRRPSVGSNHTTI